MIRLTARCAALILFASQAVATELSLPAGAQQLSERNSKLDTYSLPVAAFDGSVVPSVVYEGKIERQSWRIDTPGPSTLQVLKPLRDQLEAGGFKAVFECEDVACGGFDFRFATEVIPAPDMYVDIRNFRFLSVSREEDEAVSVLISRSNSAAFVQVIYVNRSSNGPAIKPDDAVIEVSEKPEELPDLITQLTTNGHVAMPDLVFATGADALDPGQYPSLEVLAAYLQERPTLVIGVVGHTDSIGSLDRNIELSKRRAQSVRAILVDKFGISATRIQAEGMGYLAPVASNLTAEGREENRRVEVILLSER